MHAHFCTFRNNVIDFWMRRKRLEKQTKLKKIIINLNYLTWCVCVLGLLGLLGLLVWLSVCILIRLAS